MSATEKSSTRQGGHDDMGRDPLRYVPAPRTAAEEAAVEASLHFAQQNRHALLARAMTGVAVIAMAVAIPDLSLGAMGAPETRVAMDKALKVLPQAVWTPAARASQPVYIPVMASELIAPDAVTFSSVSRYAQTGRAEFDRVMPVGVLTTGSERFDLAFAGVELPRTRLTSLSSAWPENEPAPVRLRAPALRTRIIDVPQIAELPPVRAVVSGRDTSQATAQPRRSPAPVSPGLRSGTSNLAPASSAIEAAFAGPLNVSGDIRSALPVEPQARNAPARAVPLAAAPPRPGTDTSREAAIVQKTKMDARVNGVLTGSVEFRQLDGTIAIRLRSVVGILRDRFSAEEFTRLVSGNSIDRFITLSELQGAGIPISYNPAYDEVEFGIDYKDAPNANKVQVQQITTPAAAASQSVMIDQIPR